MAPSLGKKRSIAAIANLVIPLFRIETYAKHFLKKRLAFFERPFLQHQIIGQLQLPAVISPLQSYLCNPACTVHIQAIREAQECGKFQYRLAIFWQEGFKTFFVGRRSFTTMVTHKVGDDNLFTFGQSDEMIGFEQILTVLVMVNGVDEMAKVV